MKTVHYTQGGMSQLSEWGLRQCQGTVGLGEERQEEADPDSPAMHGMMGGVCSLIAASNIFAHDVLALTRRLPAWAEMRLRGTTQPERARGRQETEQSASGSRSNNVQIVHEMIQSLI